MANLSLPVKRVSVGVDVHASTYSVHWQNDREEFGRTRMLAEPAKLISYLRNRFELPAVTVGYEAGFSGFELCRTLIEAGIKCVVIHAASIEVSRDRAKTDRRDAKKIAEQLHSGRTLKFVRVPSREEEANRLLHRSREQLVRQRKAIQAQIRMRFYQFGIRVTEPKQALTFTRIELALKKPLPENFRIGIDAQIVIWKVLDQQIRVIEKKQKELLKSDERAATYLSVPGVGLQTTCVLLTELGDMSQFSNSKKLYGFTGLTPQEYSSGPRVHRGCISRQGNARLRHVLVEAAWMAIRKDAELRRNFELLARRTGKKKAIVAIARKLIGRIRAMFQTQEFYRSQRTLKRAA